MVADTFELNGWDGHFIGANTPTKELINKIEEVDPDVIGLSLSTYFNLPQLEKMLSEISKEFSKKNIWVGGQAFRWGGNEAINKFQNTRLIDSLYKLEQMLQN